MCARLVVEQWPFKGSSLLLLLRWVRSHSGQAHQCVDLSTSALALAAPKPSALSSHIRQQQQRVVLCKQLVVLDTPCPQCTFDGNRAMRGFGFGAAIYVLSVRTSVEVADSRFTGGAACVRKRETLSTRQPLSECLASTTGRAGRACFNPASSVMSLWAAASISCSSGSLSEA